MKFLDLLERNDSGLLRLMVALGFIIFSILGIYFTYQLLLKGASGEFKIVSEWKGWRLYIASLSPGIGLFFRLLQII